ncbi:MAG: ABC-ATPase domain-containing protein, partial [Thermoanaerobaculia bacterium]|nr:ABC-ATPase domain-containing protein [Thermoanaerobaculia bacterium]
MRTLDDLRNALHRIDGRGYKAYFDIKGKWESERGVVFAVDHVQSDPFASPSKVRLIVPRALHGIPPELHDTGVRRIALCDHLLRIYRNATRSITASG